MSAYFVIRLNKLLPYLFVSLIFLGISLVLASDLFKVKNISCQTQYADCPKETEDSLGEFSGNHIFLVDEAKIKRMILADFRFRQVFVRRILPASLEVLVEERKPIGGILVGENQVFLVDTEGVVLAKVAKTNLPKLEMGERQISVGTQIDGEIRSAVVLLDLLAKAGYKMEAKLSAGIISGQILGAQVLLPLDRDPQVLVGSLQLIFTQATIEGRKPISIDLRFKNPVVRFGE